MLYFWKINMWRECKIFKFRLQFEFDNFKYWITQHNISINLDYIYAIETPFFCSILFVGGGEVAFKVWFGVLVKPPILLILMACSRLESLKELEIKFNLVKFNWTNCISTNTISNWLRVNFYLWLSYWDLFVLVISFCFCNF